MLPPNHSFLREPEYDRFAVVNTVSRPEHGAVGVVSLRESPVVITGGGPVGLVLSILLSQAGIEHLLLDTRPQTSAHPKVCGISARSMEILRRIGIEDQIRAAGLPGRTCIDVSRNKFDRR